MPGFSELPIEPAPVPVHSTTLIKPVDQELDQTSQPTALDHPEKAPQPQYGSVTYNGQIDAKMFLSISNGNTFIHRDITTQYALVASLFGNVVMESLTTHRATGNGNYTDKIEQKARLRALEGQLLLLSQGNIIFQGAETFSERETYIHALSDVYYSILLQT